MLGLGDRRCTAVGSASGRARAVTSAASAAHVGLLGGGDALGGAARRSTAQAARGAAGADGCGPLARTAESALSIFSAVVTSLGITQNVLPWPWASCGSVCRYW